MPHINSIATFNEHVTGVCIPDDEMVCHWLAEFKNYSPSNGHEWRPFTQEELDAPVFFGSITLISECSKKKGGMKYAAPSFSEEAPEGFFTLFDLIGAIEDTARDDIGAKPTARCRSFTGLTQKSGDAPNTYRVNWKP